METYKLPFAKIIKINENIAEIIVDDGIEMDIEMVNQYHEWLLENLSSPFGLLINKINKYTYTFEAQMNLATLPEILALAVVSYSSMTTASTKTLKSIPRKTKWNMEIFDERQNALEWLESELSKI